MDEIDLKCGRCNLKFHCLAALKKHKRNFCSYLYNNNNNNQSPTIPKLSKDAGKIDQSQILSNKNLKEEAFQLEKERKELLSQLKLLGGDINRFDKNELSGNNDDHGHLFKAGKVPQYAWDGHEDFENQNPSQLLQDL
ncbi:uncharacterized protein, partial [Clytia hemisphaerica]